MQKNRTREFSKVHPALPGPATAWFDGTYRVRLRELDRELGGVAKCAESQFLAIGAGLRDFRVRAIEVSKQAAKTSETLIGESSREIQERLRVLLGQLDQHLLQATQRAERGNHILGNLLGRLEDLPESLIEYRDISKTLRYLGVSTLIESSALESAQGFQYLGDALKELEQVMLTKVDKVSLRLESLAKLCRSVRSGADSHVSSRLTLMGKSDELTRSLLAAAAHKNLLAAETAQGLASRSDAVAAEISEIVTSMQYHDITRQQIDHVRTALTDLGEGLGQATAQVPRDRQSAQAQVLDEACRLQSAHLRHARDELNDAVTRIIDSLRGISKTVTATADDMQLAAGSAECDGTSIFAELDGALTNVSEALAGEIVTGQKTEQAIEAVFNEAALMSESMAEINQIGVEMKVIALNAGISAFHSGGNCPALAVVATGIQQLAERVFSRTTALTSEFTRIVEIARGLNRVAVPLSEHPTEKILDLSQEAAQLLRLLRQLNVESVERLNTMEGLAGVLTAEIEQAIAAVTVHELSRQVIDQVIYGLDEISKRVGSLPRTLPKATDDSYLQSLREHYTMQSEREIFCTVRDDGDDGGAADGTTDMTPPPLDANIEIFWESVGSGQG